MRVKASTCNYLLSFQSLLHDMYVVSLVAHTGLILVDVVGELLCLLLAAANVLHCRRCA